MTRLEEIDAQISELTKKRNEEQAKIDEVMRKEAEEKQRKLIAEKSKRYDKYMELSNKYDSDYCSNVRMYDFPFNSEENVFSPEITLQRLIELSL